jgi:hypothetical protein
MKLVNNIKGDNTGCLHEERLINASINNKKD